jgi:hypothetical protein
MLKEGNVGEVEGGIVIKTSTSMPLVSNRAAGSASAAVRQQVRRNFSEMSVRYSYTHSNLDTGQQ